MSPIMHFILAFPICIVLFPFFGWSVGIIFLSAVLIDIDHPPVYFLMFKNLDFKKMYNYFAKNSPILIDKLCAVFHTIECLAIVGILSFYSKIFLMILIGFVYHVIPDLIYLYKKTHKIRTFSIILWLNYYLKNRNTDEFRAIKEKAVF